VSGLLVGLILSCLDSFDAEKAMSDKLYFSTVHGLRVQKQSKKL
jgi:hypothetical protein